MKIERFPDSKALLRAAAEEFIALADEAIHKRGRFVVALSGGTTPRTMYEQLASATLASRVDWAKVHIFWGDERCVPPGHAESNYRVAYEALLLHVPIPPQHIHRIHGELPPEEAAAEYERRLKGFFALSDGEIPRFDLILLGMGQDGHIASLFPDSPALRERTRRVVALYVDALQTWRITFAPQVINRAANIIFLISGERKAEILRKVLCGPTDPEQLPAQLIDPVAGNLIWKVDEQAAVLLKRG